jgi:glycerol-3-phosphate acyltransferase PlsY
MFILALFAIFVSYLIGSIPFGFIAGRIFNLDIQRQGSGNIGATNVFRTIGPLPGSLVFLLDFLKGTATIYLGSSLTGLPLSTILCGLAAIAGHSYSLFLGFKGGKGVATGVGVLVGINPLAGFLSLSAALVVMGLTRYVSLGSLVGTGLAPLLLFCFNAPGIYTFFALIGAAMVFWKHLPNIQRLIAGTERKLGKKEH